MPSHTPKEKKKRALRRRKASDKASSLVAAGTPANLPKLSIETLEKALSKAKTTKLKQEISTALAGKFR